MTLQISRCLQIASFLSTFYLILTSSFSFFGWVLRFCFFLLFFFCLLFKIIYFAFFLFQFLHHFFYFLEVCSFFAFFISLSFFKMLSFFLVIFFLSFFFLSCFIYYSSLLPWFYLLRPFSFFLSFYKERKKERKLTLFTYTFIHFL